MQSEQKALTLISLENNGDRTDAVVCVCPNSTKITAQQAKLVLAARPTLAQHACKQGGIGVFADKITGCTLPHLSEHLTIDLIVERARCKATIAGNTRAEDPEHAAGKTSVCYTSPVSGNTRWLNKERGLAMISIKCTAQDQKNVTQAIIDAITHVNSLVEHTSTAQV